MLIAKLAPYQGWIGAVSAIWGVWMIISSVLSIGWLSVALIAIGVGMWMVVAGFIFSVG